MTRAMHDVPLMSLQESLDPELLVVATRWFAGITAVWQDDEWWCQNADMNAILISGEPGAVSVYFTVHQDDRSGGPDVVCTDPQDALRYVLFQSGMGQRQRYLYGRMLVPFSRSLARPGFTITPDGGLGASLTVDEPEGSTSERRLDFRYAKRATEATFYLKATFQDILDSIRDPGGEPLFGDVRQVDPTGVEHARP